MVVSKLCLVFVSTLVVLSASFTSSFAADAGAPDSSAANMTGPERKYPSVYGFSIYVSSNCTYQQSILACDTTSKVSDIIRCSGRIIKGQVTKMIMLTSLPLLPPHPHQPRFPVQYLTLR